MRTPRLRAAVAAIVLDDVDYKEVARRLGTTEGAVKNMFYVFRKEPRAEPRGGRHQPEDPGPSTDPAPGQYRRASATPEPTVRNAQLLRWLRPVRGWAIHGASDSPVPEGTDALLEEVRRFLAVLQDLGRNGLVAQACGFYERLADDAAHSLGVDHRDTLTARHNCAVAR